MKIQAVNNLYNPQIRNNHTFTGSWWNRNRKNDVNQSDTFEHSKTNSQDTALPPSYKPPINPVAEASSVEKVEDVKSEQVKEEISVEKTEDTKVKANEIDDLSLNASEMIVSLRLADMLHRLDDKSLIYVGTGDIYAKAHIRGQLTQADSFIPKPKDIKDVYMLFMPSSRSEYLLIVKDGDDFKTYGDARNITTFELDCLGKNNFRYRNIGHYGDIIELNSGDKLKLIKTGRESNIPMWDAKFPVESFLTEDIDLIGGTIFCSSKEASKFKKEVDRIRELGLLADASIPENTSNTEKTNEKSQDKSVSQPIPHRTFKDVAGLDSTIEKVKKQILFPMIYPEAFPEVTNCGTIFYGPPGTGKTLLAQAIIGEAKERKQKDINFINIDGQSLDSKWIGDTEAAWRNVFKEAVKKQPCILFIDEIDAVLAARSGNESGGERHRNGVVSQFLTLISNIEKNNHKIWIIGATNRHELIDSAIKRAGRIGNMIEVKKPDEKGCLDILNHYLKNKNIAEDFDRKDFAQQIYNLGYTGADIANLVNVAHDKMYERCGIYEKMENGTFNNSDLDGLIYEKVDFINALEQ